MPSYTPPLRDMQFVMHEVLKVADEYKAMPRHADFDVDTINAILEEGGKFAAEVTFPLNRTGDEQGCKLDAKTHEVTTPKAGRRHVHRWCRRRSVLRTRVYNNLRSAIAEAANFGA